MKKIEPALSQYRRNKSGVASRWITTQHPEVVAEFGYELRQLYTREALEAALKAGIDKAISVIVESNIISEDGSIIMRARQIDAAAIINQLIGE